MAYPATQQPPVVMQPMAGGVGQPPMPGGPDGWMAQPQIPEGCPPGLEYLTQVDQMIVKQKMEMLEAFTGFETNNKYEIRNALGQRVYFAAEDTNCCTRNCCGASRPFNIKIMDNSTREVMHLERGLRCSQCCFPCCLQKVTVESPPGTIIGYVRQAWSPCYPRFKVCDADDNTVLRISGPCCTCKICGDVEFDVTSADGSTHCGKITKQWSGMIKEIFTDTDTFGISFPLDLDVKVKAVLVGAVFLIDFMYFENNEKKDIPHPH